MADINFAPLFQPKLSDKYQMFVKLSPCEFDPEIYFDLPRILDIEYESVEVEFIDLPDYLEASASTDG